MAIIHDFSDFPYALRSFALAQICTEGILVFDEATQEVKESTDADAKRIGLIHQNKFGSWKWWVGFSAGVEALIKAVFLHNKISLLSKNAHLRKGQGGDLQLATPEAANVYTFISGTTLKADKNTWLASEFQRLNINHPYEINSATLGAYIKKLDLLETAGRITNPQLIFLRDALTVLSDVRRNVDAHVFLKTQVAGNINGDLTKLYIPAINILLAAY